jgi:hypothetical protein
MKISLKKIQKDYALQVGKHNVKITHIIDGIEENRNKTFFSCRFENSEGYIVSRFNNSEEELIQIIKLFNSCGFELGDNFTVDTNDLLNKELVIIVADQIFTDELTDEYIKIRVITDFYGIMPIKVTTNEPYSVEKEEDDLPF